MSPVDPYADTFAEYLDDEPIRECDNCRVFTALTAEVEDSKGEIHGPICPGCLEALTERKAAVQGYFEFTNPGS